MNFKCVHNNINVLDLDKSLLFYEKALGLKLVREFVPDDKSFKLVYLKDTNSSHELELTWLRDRTTPYNLGDNEIHIAYETDDIKMAHEKHLEMNCICYENKEMGIYFITDPDGYWIEIVPTKETDRRIL